MDEKICSTPLTGEFVAKHMREALGPHAILKSIKAKRIAIGQGFVSTILRLQLTWDTTEENHLPTTVIAKAPTVESLTNLMDTNSKSAEDNKKFNASLAQWIPMGHKTECDFYKMFATSPPIPMAKCYVALPVTDNAPGMIILEDLSETASCPSWATGLTYPQVIQAVSAIARFQAWSLTTTFDWRSKISTMKQDEDALRGFCDKELDGLTFGKQNYPGHFGSIDVDKLSPFMTFEHFVDVEEKHLEFMDDVLVHGDTHANNVMYEKDNRGQLGDRLVALIDFQTIAKGSPVHDLARLLTFSVSHKIRRHQEQDILRFYYDEVKSIVGDKFTASFDQISSLYKSQFAVETLFSLSYIFTTIPIMAQGEGEQRKKEETELLDRVKAALDDSVTYLGL